MINYLSAKNHKALKKAYLSNLGKINIICGKNNSGKTTLLEALCEEKKFAVGKSIESNVEWIISLFKTIANRYRNPAPRVLNEWFEKYINNLASNNTIWFSDQIESIISDLKTSMKNHPSFRGHGQDVFNFEPLLKNLFSKALAYYNPILIPPKRRLEFISEINMNQDVTPIGGGVINKLFFLKNQDIESEDYRIYKKIYDTFHYITNSKFNVVPSIENKIELFYQTEKEWITAAACGLGLSDILIIVTVLNVFKNNIFFLEEPENHLHADFQKRLLSYLASIRSKQYFLTTHSAIFLNTDVINNIYYCNNDGEVQISDQTSKSQIINSLGYSVSENLVADLIILLEGPSDIPVIREMLKWIDVTNKYNIKYWPLGGDIMASLDLSVFTERKNVISLIDSDPGSSIQRTRFQKNCKTNQIYCKKLKRYAIENYFTIKAIRETFPNQIPQKVKELKTMESVDSQIGFKRKNKSIKSKNFQIIQKMSISDIDGTDLMEFLNYVKNFLKDNGVNGPLKMQ